MKKKLALNEITLNSFMTLKNTAGLKGLGHTQESICIVCPIGLPDDTLDYDCISQGDQCCPKKENPSG